MVQRTVPAIFKQLNLTDSQQQLLGKLLKKEAKARGGDLYFDVFKKHPDIVSWNLKKIDNIQDSWFKRLIKHCTGVSPDLYIAKAMQFFKLAEAKTIRMFVGSLMFAGSTDLEIARRWKYPVKMIEAVRHLYFDFIRFEDRIAQYSVLTQLRNSGDISEEEEGLYRRAFELGEVGIKAQIAGYALTQDEERKVQEYLAKSVAVNIFNLNFMIKDSNDMANYNKVMNDMAKINLSKQLIELKRKECDILELDGMKKRRELAIGDADRMLDEDEKLLTSAIAPLMYRDVECVFKSRSDLELID